MSQDALTHGTTVDTQGDEHSHGGTLLGPLLCWAVVFADIGTSVYYVPGILYGNVGNLAGFFVLLTMSVFVLLTLKYAEVTHRFPQGGGVVTVAASAINKWVGALGGMFILVDYFLTAAISCLSGMQYLSVVLPSLGVISFTLPLYGAVQLPLLFLTIGVLILLGLLNWVGISESAKVSFVGAVIAFGSDIAILITVFTHLSLSTFLKLFSETFASNTLGPKELLIGFAGSFLAFSGLESISQLSPVMRTPRKKIAGIALLLVVLTIGITSPLLTMFSTLLQPEAAKNPIEQSQLISLLAGHWGNGILKTEVAISASALLVFASNTAIIGAYHVFMALARLGFFPAFILKRNKVRGTPHYSIMLATGIPIVVLLLVLGNINVLGDMYAFGLLGAFTLTCLGLDIVRYKDRRAARRRPHVHTPQIEEDGVKITATLAPLDISQEDELHDADSSPNGTNGAHSTNGTYKVLAHVSLRDRLRRAWGTLDFGLGIITTFLVMVAWSTNLVAKPLATLFGGSVTIIGMVIAYFNYRHQESQGQTPIHVVSLSSVEQLSHATLAVLLTGKEKHNDLVVQAATKHLNGKPLAFLYIGEPKNAPPLQPFEYYEPYLYDESAIQTLRTAETMMLATNANADPQFLYRPIQQVSESQEADIVTRIWQTMHPHEILIAAEDVPMLGDISPNRIRYETLSGGKVAHLVSQW